MKKSLLWILIAALLVLCTGCSAGPGQPSSTQTSSGQTAPAQSSSGDAVVRTPMTINVGCGTSTGVGYITASTVGSLLSAQYPEYQVKPEITTGALENIRLIHSGVAQLASAMSDVALAAYEGNREFDASTKDSIRYITSGNLTTITQFARDGLEAKELPDLKGKRIGVASGTMANYYWPILLNAYGLKEDDFKSVTVLQIKDIVNNMGDGTIDYGVHVTSVPNSTIADLALTNGIRVLTMSDEIRDKIIEVNPYFIKTTIGKDVYGTEQDSETLAVRNIYVCPKDADEQMVYDWVKTIDENNDKLTIAHPQAGEYGRRENVLESQLFPFHPGAERYYREVGLIK